MYKLLGALWALRIFGTESEHSYVLESKGCVLVLYETQVSGNYEFFFFGMALCSHDEYLLFGIVNIPSVTIITKALPVFIFKYPLFKTAHTHCLRQMSEFTVSALTYTCVCDRLIFLARGCRSVLTTICCIIPRYTSKNDRDKPQAVIRPTFTTEALARFGSSGICGAQNGTEEGFLRVLRAFLSVSFRQGSIQINSSLRDGKQSQ
jgi:hypothetical protein